MRVPMLVSLLLVTAAGQEQPREPHPGYSPTFLRGSASREKGKVIVQLQRPGPDTPPLEETEQAAPLPLVWVDLRPVTLGETVQAFQADGKALDKRGVLKALAKPRGVAVFMRTYAEDPLEPSPFYRALLHGETVILVVKAEDLYNPEP